MGEQLVGEAKSTEFRAERSRNLLEEIHSFFVREDRVTNHEVLNSGIVNSLFKFLCLPPGELRAEEGKGGEEKEVAGLEKKGEPREQALSRTDAELLMKRYLCFFRVFTQHKSRRGILELVEALQTALSNKNNELFLQNVNAAAGDLWNTVSQLKNLSRRHKFTLVYDPQQQ